MKTTDKKTEEAEERKVRYEEVFKDLDKAVEAVIEKHCSEKAEKSLQNAIAMALNLIHLGLMMNNEVVELYKGDDREDVKAAVYMKVMDIFTDVIGSVDIRRVVKQQKKNKSREEEP